MVGGRGRSQRGSGGAFTLQHMYVCVVVNIYVLFVKNKKSGGGVKVGVCFSDCLECEVVLVVGFLQNIPASQNLLVSEKYEV